VVSGNCSILVCRRATRVIVRSRGDVEEGSLRASLLTIISEAVLWQDSMGKVVQLSRMYDSFRCKRLFPCQFCRKGLKCNFQHGERVVSCPGRVERFCRWEKINVPCELPSRDIALILMTCHNDKIIIMLRVTNNAVVPDDQFTSIYISLSSISASMAFLRTSILLWLVADVVIIQVTL
jgi:hypothetical protein